VNIFSTQSYTFYYARVYTAEWRSKQLIKWCLCLIFAQIFLIFNFWCFLFLHIRWIDSFVFKTQNARIQIIGFEFIFILFEFEFGFEFILIRIRIIIISNSWIRKQNPQNFIRRTKVERERWINGGDWVSVVFWSIDNLDFWSNKWTYQRQIFTIWSETKKVFRFLLFFVFW